jgi:hypothetical protein
MLLKHVVLHDKNKMNLLYDLNLNVEQQYHLNILIQKLNRLLFHRQNVRPFSSQYFRSFIVVVVFLDNVEIRHDEYPRKGTSIDALSKLNTVFKEGKILLSKINRYLSYFFFSWNSHCRQCIRYVLISIVI